MSNWTFAEWSTLIGAVLLMAMGFFGIYFLHLPVDVGWPTVTAGGGALVGSVVSSSVSGGKAA